MELLLLSTVPADLVEEELLLADWLLEAFVFVLALLEGVDVVLELDLVAFVLPLLELLVFDLVASLLVLFLELSLLLTFPVLGERVGWFCLAGCVTLFSSLVVDWRVVGFCCDRLSLP